MSFFLFTSKEYDFSHIVVISFFTTKEEFHKSIMNLNEINKLCI